MADFYDSVISNIAEIEEPKYNDITPEDSLDILEISLSSDDSIKTIQELTKEKKETSVDLKLIRNYNSQSKGISEYLTAKQDVEANLTTRTKEENISAIRNMEAAQDPGNLMFNDIPAGKTAREAVDNSATDRIQFDMMQQGGLKTFANLETLTPEESEIDVRGGEFTTKKEKDEYRQGRNARYISDIMFLPMFMYALVDDKDWEENKADYYAWESYMAEQASKSAAYAKGNGWRGSVLAFAIDPFGGSVGKAPFLGTALGIKVLKSAKAVEKLGKIMGHSNLLSLMSRSGESLVDFFRTDDQMIEMILKETANSNDPVSKKLFDAAVTAKLTPEDKVFSGANRSYKSPIVEVAETAAQSGDTKAQDIVANTVLDATSKEASEASVKAVDAGDGVQLSLFPDQEVPLVDAVPMTSYGTDVNNATKVAASVANRILYNTVTKAQEAVSNVHTLRVGPAVEGSLQRAFELGQEGEVFQKTNFLRTLLPGAWKFKGATRQALIDNVTRNKITQALIKKGLGQQLDIVYRGLSKNEESILNKLVYAADNAEDFGTVVDGGIMIGDDFFEATPKILDKYHARQISMKNAHYYLNSTAVTQARKKGWKVFQGKTAAPAKITDVAEDLDIISAKTGEKISRDEAKLLNIYEVTDYADPDYVRFVAATEDDVASKFDDMTFSHKVIGEQNGYMRIEYTDKYKIFNITKDGEGNVISITPTATSRTWNEARGYVNRLSKEAEEAANKAVAGGVPAERIKLVDHIAIRNSEGLSDFIYNPSFWDSLSKMTDEQMEVVNRLFKEGGLSEQAMKDLFAARDRFGYKRPSPLRPRGEKRLESLSKNKENYLIGKSADAKYFDWVSRYVSEGDYISQLEKAFVDKYGQFFPQLQRDTYATINPLGKHPLAREASAYQNHLATIANKQRSIVLSASDRTLQWVADKFIRSNNKAISFASEAIADFLPLPSQLLRGASHLTTAMALGSFGLIQLPLQFSAAALNSLGASAGRALFGGTPVQATKAALEAQGDFLMYLSTKIPVLNKFGIVEGKVGKSIRETWDFVESSGIAAGIDYDDISRMITDTKNMKGWTSIFKRPVGALGNAGAQFYKAGENLGQVYALLMSRRLVAAEGVLKIGSDAFNDAVLMRAKTLALNMAKHNSTALTQNELTGLLLKFKDFGIHQGALFDPRQLFGKSAQGLNPSEVVGLYATWMGLFGVAGIPFSWDAMIAAEMISGSGDPDEGAGRFTIEFVQNRAKDIAELANKLGMKVEAEQVQRYLEGGIPAVINKELMVASRFAISSFISDYLTASSMDEAMLGAVYSKMRRFLGKDIPESFQSFMVMVRNGEFSAEQAMMAAEPLANQFSGVANMIKAGKMVWGDDGRLRDSHGNVLIDQPNLTQKLMTVMGATPGELVKVYQHREVLRRQKQALKDYLWDNSKKISETYYRSGQEAGDWELDLVSADLEHNGYSKLIPNLINMVFGQRAFMDKNISAKERLQFEAMQQIQNTGNFNAVIDSIMGEVD